MSHLAAVMEQGSADDLDSIMQGIAPLSRIFRKCVGKGEINSKRRASSSSSSMQSIMRAHELMLEKGIATVDAARIAGASRDVFRTYCRLLKSEESDLIEEVQSGRLPVSTADQIRLARMEEAARDAKEAAQEAEKPTLFLNGLVSP